MRRHEIRQCLSQLPLPDGVTEVPHKMRRNLSSIHELAPM